MDVDQPMDNGPGPCSINQYRFAVSLTEYVLGSNIESWAKWLDGPLAKKSVVCTIAHILDSVGSVFMKIPNNLKWAKKKNFEQI